MTVKHRPAQRALDIIIVLALSPVWLGVLMMCALVIRVVDGAPVIFRQERQGRERVPFTALKLRTMVVDADELLLADGSSASDRLTKTGPILRRTGIDELPQLINVLRGDMSLVGPRPLPEERAKTIPQSFAGRWDVRPGITGLAQVSGRNSLKWSERLSLDLDYIAGPSIVGDFRILAKTIAVIATGSGFVSDRNPESIDDLPTPDE